MCRVLFLKRDDRKDVFLAKISSSQIIKLEKLKLKKMSHSPKLGDHMGKSPSRFKVNCIWTICVLSLFLIVAVTIILLSKIQISNLEDFLSSASLVLSLVLSIFAIMYTYTSNAKVENKFEKIDSAATKIENVSSTISSTADKLNQNIEAILSKLSKVDIALGQLTQNTVPGQDDGDNVVPPATNLDSDKAAKPIKKSDGVQKEPNENVPPQAEAPNTANDNPSEEPTQGV